MDKSSKKVWIISLFLVCFFSMFLGYYLSYRVNEKEKTKLEIIQEIMENEWYYGIDDEDIETTLETRMILSLQDLETDPYTKYLTSLGSLADSYTGLGITISLYEDYYIVSEVSSQVSIDAGVKVNDILVSINGEDLKNKSLKEIQEIISSRDDIRLGIVRNSDYSNVIYIDTRVTSYEPVTVFTKEYNDSVAYVKITQFDLNTAGSIKSYFASLDSNYDDLIIDLRGNPGGYIDSVRDVMDLFVLKDKIVMSTVDKHGNVSVVKTRDDTAYIFEEIYVLIDSNSASGAEALAAAMDYHLNNVILYGDTTYGKGSAQKTYHFDDGTYFHYTYALWKTPFNKTINHIGVEPHIKDINLGIGKTTLYSDDFKLYDYGDGVKSIQEILEELGYYHGVCHSFFDEETEAALKQFQLNYGLEETGVYDASTRGVFAKLVYDDNYDFNNEQIDRVLALFN